MLTSDVVDAYLARIGHGPVQAPDLPTLGSLQDAHVRSVPFENLDIHLGRPLSLEIQELTTKVVAQRRGGFCFELNGLFSVLLATLGYRVDLVEARQRTEDGGLGPRFDHARILVHTEDGPVVVDVGSGASPRGPIRLSPAEQQIGHIWHRVLVRDGRYDSQQRDAAGWTTDWSFDLTPQRLEVFAERCVYHQRSPQSHFTHKPLATLVTGDGHVTLADTTLITTRDGRRMEQTVADPLDVLAERFGITIPRWPGSTGERPLTSPVLTPPDPAQA